jgi:methionyl-tRNA formyltransferase
MGTPVFALPSLRALAARHQLVGVVTRPDKARGRGRQRGHSAVKEWALDAGVPIEQPPSLRHGAARDALAGYRPEAIVVVAYGLILPPEVLALPPHGCINVHASLLPRHRGAAPIAWAILAGDEETGVTTMLMDEGLDTGDILRQRAVPIGRRETAIDLGERLARVGAELIVETLEGLEAGSLAPRPQDDERATLAPSFTKADGGIDWRRSAVDIDRRVRALQPWPGSFTHWRRERLSLWEVEPDAAAGAGQALAGTVIDAGDHGIRVACGDGSVLRIVELQRAGGRRQPAAEFLRGHDLAAGDRLETAAA